MREIKGRARAAIEGAGRGLRNAFLPFLPRVFCSPTPSPFIPATHAQGKSTVNTNKIDFLYSPSQALISLVLRQKGINILALDAAYAMHQQFSKITVGFQFRMIA